MEHLILTPYQLTVALQSRRKTLNLTQVDAAAKVGLLPKTISALENNPERCTLDSFLKLLSALDLELTLKPKPIRSDDSQKGEW
ncbi:MAG TPA: helix-turn-helix domain-containing protein [Sphaerochaeta sp.]|nr:helix-turn-helix domain-containing protein [Sphaerochaeta sp.]